MAPKRTRPTVGADMDSHIGARIRMRRHYLGMSMQAVATRLDVLRQTVEKWEHGTARLSVGQLYAVGNVLGVHPGWFFDEYQGGEVEQHRPRDLDALMQIPDAVHVLMSYARLDETERAAVLVLMASAGKDREPTMDGRDKPLVRLVDDEPETEEEPQP